MFNEYIIEKMLDKALDKALELIRGGFRMLDTNSVFFYAYENALAEYKNECMEDELYNKFYKEEFSESCDVIKHIIDTAPSARELESELISKISELLPNFPIDKVEIFVTKLFVELLLRDEYKSKILKYRQDNEIGEIHDKILELIEIFNGTQSIRLKFENNMFQYYLDKWNNNLFLHKNTEKKIRLKDLYVLPFYKDKNSYKSEGIRKNLNEQIDLFLGDTIVGNRRRPMLILADAGMGKSSLVSYICSKCPQKENLIVLKFADLHKDSLDANILSSVLYELNCQERDLRNKRLIIDGFDESEFTSDKNKLLSNFFNKCQNIQGLKVLVTSRVNYVDCMKFTNCKLYYLQFMNEEQVIEMSKKYFSLSKENPFSINISNNEVMGVPLILYMLLSLRIHVEKDTGICELYEKIFAFDGGIYDRMTMDNSDGYTEEVHPIAYYDAKREVHLISQLIAFSMFETGSLLLTKDRYLNIVKDVSESRVEDFAVSNYYYIESSTYVLSFCHKSIYEYFVAEYIYNKISSSEETEDIARNLAKLLKRNLLTEEILRFLNYKIKGKYQNDEHIYSKIEIAVNLMIQNGMTYFLDSPIIDVLQTEKMIFLNIFSILDIYNVETKYKDYKRISMSTQFLSQLNNRYDNVINLQHILLRGLNLNKKKYLTNLNLSNSELSDINFEGSDLSLSVFKNVILKNIIFDQTVFNETKFNELTKLFNVKLRFAKLTKCEFLSCTLENVSAEKTIFENCSFENAKLVDVIFKKAELKDANFRNAVLSVIDFTDANLKDADLRGADMTKINLHVAKQVDSIKIDENSIFNYALVDSTLVPKLIIKCAKKNLKGLRIYDVKTNKEISLKEYQNMYSGE